jgi:hypothetical protein
MVDTSKREKKKFAGKEALWMSVTATIPLSLFITRWVNTWSLSKKSSVVKEAVD